MRRIGDCYACGGYWPLMWCQECDVWLCAYHTESHDHEAMKRTVQSRNQSLKMALEKIYERRSKMKLIQLHWQNPTNPKQTDFVAQAEFDDSEACQKWANEIIKSRKAECPDGWVPMLCWEGSEHFALAASNEARLL